MEEGRPTRWRRKWLTVFLLALLILVSSFGYTTFAREAVNPRSAAATLELRGSTETSGKHRSTKLSAASGRRSLSALLGPKGFRFQQPGAMPEPGPRTLLLPGAFPTLPTALLGAVNRTPVTGIQAPRGFTTGSGLVFTRSGGGARPAPTVQAASAPGSGGGSAGRLPFPLRNGRGPSRTSPISDLDFAPGETPPGGSTPSPPTPTPEPSAALLFAFNGLLVSYALRRRRSATPHPREACTH